jgi:hypothetical protein
LGWQRPWLAVLGGIGLVASLLGATVMAWQGIPGGLGGWGMFALFVFIVAIVNATGTVARRGLRAVLFRALSLAGTFILGGILASAFLLCVFSLMRF